MTDTLAWRPWRAKISLDPGKIMWVGSFHYDYIYLGDRNTAESLKGHGCSAIRRGGKCVRGRNGNMLVQFEDGSKQVVVARLLRKRIQIGPDIASYG